MSGLRRLIARGGRSSGASAGTLSQKCVRKLSGTSTSSEKKSGSVYASQFYKVGSSPDSSSRHDVTTPSSSSTSTSSSSPSLSSSSASPRDNEPFIVGEIIDNAVDLSTARPGDSIEVPYEITISHSFRDFWQSAFYSHDRINTSTPFARALGLQDQVVPFSLMLFLAGSMSHADHAKLQTGFGNARYHWPAFAGDTFKKRFVIMSLRSTSDGRHSIFTIHCELKNQRGVVLFTCEKTMLFPFKVPSSSISMPSAASAADDSAFLHHLIEQSDNLQTLGSHTLASLRPMQLILHTLTRPLSETHSMQLATLARLTHERHFNTRLFRREELFIPGGLVLGLTLSLASRDLHEVLYEELIECSFPNNLHPGETVGSITFVKSLEEHVSGDVEAITIRTIGVKNTDVHRALINKNVPLEIFNKHILRPAALEEVLKRSCPELSKLIVCVADRKIYRQAPKQVPFLL